MEKHALCPRPSRCGHDTRLNQVESELEDDTEHCETKADDPRGAHVWERG
jgi:hypothetical protein